MIRPTPDNMVSRATTPADYDRGDSFSSGMIKEVCVVVLDFRSDWFGQGVVEKRIVVWRWKGGQDER